MSHSIHKCIIKQIIIFMVQICHTVRHYLCHKNDTRCRKHCSNWGGVWRKCHMHPPTKVLHISDGVTSRHQIVTTDQCHWGWDCTYLVLSFFLTPSMCSIAPCKSLRKRSFPNVDRWVPSLWKKLSLTNFNFSMLDVASSRAHTCLLDGQLGFGFDSWLWCLLSFVIVFSENLSQKSSTIVSLSSTFGNRFANFANDSSPTTSHLTDVIKNIVWFEVDLGEPYSINNFKLYYRKKGICNNKKNLYQTRTSLW